MRWSVLGAVTVVVAGLVASSQLAPGSLDAGTIAMAAVGGGVLVGIIVVAVRGSEAVFASRDALVTSVDAALRELAARGRGVYVPGGSYAHPMIGTIRYCGSVRGDGWVARLEEEDGETGFEIVIPDVALRRRDLKPHTSPAPARPLLERLHGVTHRLDIVERAWSLFDPTSGRDGTTRCLQAAVRGIPASHELEAIVLDLTRLAGVLGGTAR